MTEREIIEKIAAMEPGVPSEIDGDVSCYFCFAWIGLGDKHTDDCVWEHARKIVATAT
jgi:hypothetical protein